MRDRSFRVWDKDLKKMFYLAFSISSYGDVIDAGWKEYDYQTNKIIGGVDCIVMDSTGLKDKNGKEIYEGDFVKPSGLRDDFGRGIVEWDENKLAFVVHPKGWHKHSNEFLAFLKGMLVKIGNIYENPELRRPNGT